MKITRIFLLVISLAMLAPVPVQAQTSQPPATVAAILSSMTPEERRKLRQDVHEAGRDLYPERMRERRREMRRGE